MCSVFKRELRPLCYEKSIKLFGEQIGTKKVIKRQNLLWINQFRTKCYNANYREKISGTKLVGTKQKARPNSLFLYLSGRNSGVGFWNDRRNFLWMTSDWFFQTAKQELCSKMFFAQNFRKDYLPCGGWGFSDVTTTRPGTYLDTQIE